MIKTVGENSSDFVNYLIRENDFQFPRELRLKEKERETVQGQETAIAKSSIKIDKTFFEVSAIAEKYGDSIMKRICITKV